MPMLAHPLDSNRTKDVLLEENVTFELLLLNKLVLSGLAENGFKKPSPIQLKAIPVGRCGFDLIVKSKSGTGKTLVYAVVALEAVDTSKNETQVLILVPTREIVIQIEEVLMGIGRYIEGLQVKCFIGGLPLDNDKENCKLCHIAIGTPGRVKHLIKENYLKVNLIRLFVLDEVDKLMENSFLNDINEIYNNLPNKTQIITTSATYTTELKHFLQKYMLSPTYVGVHNDTPFLWGLKQFVKIVKHHTNVAQQMKMKTEEVLNIFSNISFTQCIIFTNYQVRAESISNTLNRKGWASTYVSAARPQSERIAAIKDLKKFNCKIMLSTDLTARGIDAASIDLVINYDVPHDATTYLHRMGRAGRYGASGICINLVSQGAELEQIQNIIYKIEGSTITIPELPDFSGSLCDLLNVNGVNHFSETSINSVQVHTDCPEFKIREDQEDIQHQLTEPKQEKNKIGLTNCKVNHSMVESNINIILNETKREEELIRNQLCNEDTDVLLKTLASGKCDVDSYKSNNNSLACTQVQQIILNNIYGISDNNHLSNVTLSTEHESKKVKKCESLRNISSEEILYHKNKALLCVSSIIFYMECHNVVPNDLECIQTYLNILKDEENKCILRIPCQNPIEILKDIEFLNPLNNANNCNQNSVEILDDIEHLKPLKNTVPISSNCLESIFKIGYDFATKSTSKHWNSYFPDSQVTSCASKEQTLDTADDYYLREEIAMSNESVVSEEEEIDSIENFMKWIPVEQTGKTHRPEPESNANSWEHYYKYFSDYSNQLWENGLSFENVEDFDNWFYYEWQMNISAVRNYVQQNIYHQEMKKHHDSKVNLI